MLEAVIFDWGHTLIDLALDDELLQAGRRAGIEAAGKSAGLAPALTERYRAAVELEESVDDPAHLRTMLSDVGAEVDDEELRRFLVAQHEARAPGRKLASTSHALLDSLRERGLGLGLVSNSFEPRWLLERDLEEQGLGERLDATVFSSEVGARKPDPAIFERALEELGVEPERAAFVGDDLRADIAGAAAVGLTTVQALWFRADESVEGIEPDFQAFTQLDVLNIVRRLTGER